MPRMMSDVVTWSGQAEVYSLNILFLALVLLFTFLWETAFEADGPALDVSTGAPQTY